ncbi:MAG: ADP-ribosylation factor family protein [Candidatus Hermodarchaeota archaeon]
MSWMRKLFFRVEKKVQISLCGLDAAGKTTVLNYLIAGQKTETVPTTGINYEKIALKNRLTFDIYDLPGQEALRSLWDKYILTSNLLVFVLDAADHERLEEAKNLFWEVYNHQSDPSTPICILANKQDLKDAIPTTQIIEKLELSNLKGCKWQVFGTSALIGKNIIEAFQWIYETISNKKIKMNVNIRDILVFGENGVLIASKCEVLGQPRLAASFLSAIQTMTAMTVEDAIESILLEKYRICFKHVNEHILALIMDRDDDEKVGNIILNSLAEKLSETMFSNAESLLHHFTLSDLKGLVK